VLEESGVMDIKAIISFKGKVSSKLGSWGAGPNKCSGKPSEQKQRCPGALVRLKGLSISVKHCLGAFFVCGTLTGWD
jgi:hypothetical protein